MRLRMKTASWVIIDRETGRIIMETYNFGNARRADRKFFRVISILTHLQNLNGANR